MIWTCGFVCPSAAIEVQPAQTQVQVALDRGKEAAEHRRAPETFYARFGSGDDLQPGGFLVTKLGGLSVMATHMALRGLEPSAADIAQVTEAPTMLVSTVIFGDSPSFAVNSYIVLDQGGGLSSLSRCGSMAKPVAVRYGRNLQNSRQKSWPLSAMPISIRMRRQRSSYFPRSAERSAFHSTSLKSISRWQRHQLDTRTMRKRLRSVPSCSWVAGPTAIRCLSQRRWP